MKNYAKVGNREGKPAYRTPSRIRYEKSMATKKRPGRTWNLAKRMETGRKREVKK